MVLKRRRTALKTGESAMRVRRYQLPLLVLAILASSLLASPALADDPGSDRKAFDQAVAAGIDYLRTKGQAADGSYSAEAGPAITAIVTTAVLKHGRTVNDPQVEKALKYLEGFVHEDGGIYAKDSKVSNYETSLGIMCFVAANKDGRYDKLLKNAEAYVKKLQWDGEEGHDQASAYYGGAGYGGHSRPDLSNTQFLLEALRAAGNGPEDPAVQKALVFVSRCQNLETEHNTTPFAAKNPDGGFYYTPAAGGKSQAGETTDGGLRSYGSMTYAGLKSMIFAGVTKDDPRVVAARKWLREHYTVDENPGMGQAGLFYYYHTMAKALNALGQPTFEDAKSQQHNWRTELVAELVKRQKPNGSWLNETKRWMEGDPNLATAYALLVLDYCRPLK
jgi:squalene-hopene/tetraprenyl-beta-curcumene cyclase